MSLNEFELHSERLATTDAKGKRIYLHPADVKGFFRTQRTRLQFVLIVFFLGLPWIQINGRQALLLDLAQRRFEIFGLSLRAHNAPLLFFVFAAAGFGLFFATSVFGRIWCGWACPQTVFIDGIFRRIERWIEGSALERRKLDAAPMTLSKLTKRSLKWFAFVLATLIITHSFMAYFIGVDQLATMIRRPPTENWGSFLFMLFSSGIILFDFAWFREQFCTIACPYGRFQSVLMDKSSMVVAYDVNRGEPRATAQAKILAKNHSTNLGDCVNCYRCVQVCPTGIDIRRGVQMECIACTACIDACDDVMTKVHKPKGLIRYNTSVSTPKANVKVKLKFTSRSAVYLTLCLASVIALTVFLSKIKPVDVQILRAKDTPYSVQTVEDGTSEVMNHFLVELSNQSGVRHELLFLVPNDFDKNNIHVVTAIHPLPIENGQVTRTDVFIHFNKTLLENGQKKIRLLIKDKNSISEHVIEIEKEVMLVGPFF